MANSTFLGAARTVTGSKYLLEHKGRRVLFDCGLFQGLKELRLRNWDEFPVPPDSLDAVVLTHAHLDHVGYLPRLIAQGYKGRVFCTPGTKDLCQLVLPDAGRIQEEDARQANKHGYSKHDPALPLFSESDALRALTYLQPLGFERAIDVAPGISIEFHPAGHLLGSAFVIVRLAGGPNMLFGGDLGRYNRPILPDPSGAIAADVVLVESTYGDRDHQAGRFGSRQLADVIKRHRRAKRQARDPGVCHRARRGAALLGAAAGSGASHSRASRVRGQSDGHRGAQVLLGTRRGARSGIAADVGSGVRLRDDAVPDDRVASAVQGAHGESPAGSRDLVERHGDGWTRPASSCRGAARSEEHGALRRAIRRPALAGGSSSTARGKSGFTAAASR